MKGSTIAGYVAFAVIVLTCPANVRWFVFPVRYFKLPYTIFSFSYDT